MFSYIIIINNNNNKSQAHPLDYVPTQNPIFVHAPLIYDETRLQGSAEKPLIG